MPRVIAISDLVDPDDPQGRTYKQINAEKVHAIPVGALVALSSGARGFVVLQSRDCDQTPLYYLSIDRKDVGKSAVECGAFSEYFRPGHWMGGYCEESLRVISII